MQPHPPGNPYYQEDDVVGRSKAYEAIVKRRADAKPGNTGVSQRVVARIEWSRFQHQTGLI